MKIQSDQILLFIGDSITDCGRERPVGGRNGLGSGYVDQTQALLEAGYPDRTISVLNTGISGNRITDLAKRWQTDVLDLSPDWLAIMIGINDVWRQFDALQDPVQVSPEEFENVYRDLLQRTRPACKGLVLMTPFFLETNLNDPMRSRMNEYSQIVASIANETDAIFVDVQAAFDRYLRHRPTQSLCGDRVHPNRTGHAIIASAFLSTIGFDWTVFQS